MKSCLLGLFSCLIVALPAVAHAQTPSQESVHPRHEFTTLVAHWAEYADPGYLSFLEAAQPEVAQVGFYGAHFWSLAHTTHGKGYPAHFPLVGLTENREWFANLNREIHKRGIKVVGHMNVKFLVGDPDSPKTDTESGGPRGFFKFYRELWNEELLGPKPVADPLDLLEKDAEGKPITVNNYSIGGMKEYWGCLNNPHWRAVLKAWTKHGIEQGCDGFIANYFYRHNCLCPHCVTEFKTYLGNRFTADELRMKFEIADVNAHQFKEIVSWHKPEESTPLRREMLRFSQIANKQAFDEVFVKYGRSLKPDLLVAQWNHLGSFNQLNGDERCLLPAEMWGRDEDYLWYSTGDAAYFTDLPEGILGEGTLQARFIRGAFNDKPFTLGKYEGTRIRAAISELAANGGAPMGFYTRFTDPAARDEIVRYYQFLRKYDGLFRANRPQSEVLLLFPRCKIHEGDLTPLERFRHFGKQLLDEHVLFDVCPDDIVTPEIVKRYRQIISPTDCEKLSPHIEGLSQFEAPMTVRVSLSIPATLDELTLHLVNYNRHEPEAKRSAGGGIKDERPIATENIRIDLRVAKDATNIRTVTTVELLSPEQPEPIKLLFDAQEDRLRFVVPSFLVYGVVRIR